MRRNKLAALSPEDVDEIELEALAYMNRMAEQDKEPT